MNEGTMANGPIAGASNGSATSTSDESAKGLVAKGKEKLAAVKDKVFEAKDSVVGRSTAIVEKTRSLITAHPLKAIAIAFGLGYIGMRVTRRFR